MRRRKMLCAAPAVLLAACATESGRFAGPEAPPAGRAALYIYRNDRTAGNTGVVVPNLTVNHERVAPLRKGGFLHLVLEPGPAEVVIVDFELFDEQRVIPRRGMTINVRLAPDRIHFVEFGLARGFYVIGERPAAVALPLLADLVRLN